MYINRQLSDDGNYLSEDILNPSQLKEPLEECIAKRRIPCRWYKGASIHKSKGFGGPSHMSQMSLFCGHHPECDVFESEALFQRALTNFEKRFVVTGVLEHFNKSIKGNFHNSLLSLSNAYGNYIFIFSSRSFFAKIFQRCWRAIWIASRFVRSQP